MTDTCLRSHLGIPVRQIAEELLHRQKQTILNAVMEFYEKLPHKYNADNSRNHDWTSYDEGMADAADRIMQLIEKL